LPTQFIRLHDHPICCIIVKLLGIFKTNHRTGEIEFSNRRLTENNRAEFTCQTEPSQ